jgi:hypothetical protein
MLLLLVGMCGWIADEVLPEMWAVGEQFGIYPTRLERVHRHFVRAVGFAAAVTWWVLVVALVAKVFG